MTSGPRFFDGRRANRDLPVTEFIRERITPDALTDPPSDSQMEGPAPTTKSTDPHEIVLELLRFSEYRDV